MTVHGMCQTAAVSRAGLYRHRNRPNAAIKDMDLRDEIQKIALEWPAYGRRRITQELRDRGWKVNGKGSSALCVRTTCWACVAASSW